MQAWLSRVLPGARQPPRVGERIQSLWSGFGELCRVHTGDETDAAVLKWVDPESAGTHPRGWSGEVSRVRKLQSYRVEIAFYRALDPSTQTAWRVPAYRASEVDEAGRSRLLLEDLDHAGFTARPAPVYAGGHLDDVLACARWLAAFHAAHLGVSPDGLWPVGCYWHLGTRFDEWNAMPSGALKTHASALDGALSEATHQTWVHGDAKLANFCLRPADNSAAALDFQYVGGGVGVRDVAVLCASAFDDGALVHHADAVLDSYFAALRPLLKPGAEGAEVEKEWRALWPLAWADYMRFLEGWMPGHPRRTAYADAQVRAALATVS